MSTTAEAPAPQTPSGGDVPLYKLNDIASTLTVNNYFGVLQAVLNHLGIGVLPDYTTEENPHLVRVLEEVESGEVPVFLAYPEALRHSKRVAAFRDFVTEEISTFRRSHGS